jgi:hypothetical protein
MDIWTVDKAMLKFRPILELHPEIGAVGARPFYYLAPCHKEAIIPGYAIEAGDGDFSALELPLGSAWKA